MHPAVDLLLKRMESNPDEFVNQHQKNRRWEILIERYKDYMDDADREEVRKKYSELQMGQLHKEIMAELLREPKEEPEFYAKVSTNVSTHGFGWTDPTAYNLHTQQIQAYENMVESYQKSNKSPLQKLKDFFK